MAAGGGAGEGEISGDRAHSCAGPGEPRAGWSAAYAQRAGYAAFPGWPRVLPGQWHDIDGGAGGEDREAVWDDVWVRYRGDAGNAEFWGEFHFF